jgi:hypothetical protein
LIPLLAAKSPLYQSRKQTDVYQFEPEIKAIMNKLKYLFTTILCAAFFAGAATNVSSQTVAKSVKRDAAGMIEFYEWAFDTDFTADQRARMEGFLEKDFRENAAAARRETDSVAATFAGIKRMNSEARREARRAFLNAFLPNLKRSEASNPEANFLLEIYRAAHNGNDVLTTLDAASGDVFDKRAFGKATNHDGSPNLIGKWTRGKGDGFVDYTGKTRYKAGETFTFEFFDDGTVEYVYQSDVLSVTQCRTTESGKASGTFEANGNSLTMNLGAMKTVGTSSCDRKNNFTKTLPASAVTKKFTVKRMDSITRPDKPLLLCFDGQADETCFEKSNK